MDEDATTVFLGWYIAAQPLAQFVSSPLTGYLGNRLGSVRWPIAFLQLVLAGSFVFYACVSAIAGPRRWYLFASRFLVGVSGGKVRLRKVRLG